MVAASLQQIVTVTLNPAIDGACETDVVRPVRKIRTTNEKFSAGGGGINVASVIYELGGVACAIYLSGGLIGRSLDGLVARLGFASKAIPIADETRIAQVVYERSTKLEYRFVPEGPNVQEHEWRACLATLASTASKWIVISGSLPPGVPPEFHADVAAIARQREAHLVIDTSGAALKSALAQGGIELVKPSLGEMESCTGRSLRAPGDLENAAMELVRAGIARNVAVTLGADGAVLATASGIVRLRAPDVEVRSAVGAGDSFVAAMTLRLSQGAAPEDAFAFGVAAGTAAVMRHGPHLCSRKDVLKLYEDVRRDAAP